MDRRTNALLLKADIHSKTSGKAFASLFRKNEPVAK
jgi:hypothetical protein